MKLVVLSSTPGIRPPAGAHPRHPRRAVSRRGGTDRPVQMRVMDWWRADAGLLVENWVLLDLPHFFLQLDVDLLARVHEVGWA